MVASGKGRKRRPAGGERSEPEAGRDRACRRYTPQQKLALLKALRTSGLSLRAELRATTFCIFGSRSRRRAAHL